MAHKEWMYLRSDGWMDGGDGLKSNLLRFCSLSEIYTFFFERKIFERIETQRALVTGLYDVAWRLKAGRI